MSRIAWGSFFLGIVAGFVLRHLMKGRTAVTS
jgi:hypothetical protein